MLYLLGTRLPQEGMTQDERKRLAVGTRNFYLIQDILYHKGASSIWRMGVRSNKKMIVLREAHCNIVGGHNVGDATTRKIWRNGLWWPTTHKDAFKYCRECDMCQRMDKLTEQARMPHQPIPSLEPFKKLGLYFVRPFKLAIVRTGNRYMIKYIWCRFSCVIGLISDHGGHFINKVIEGLTLCYTVADKKSTLYYPQANELSESSNKII